MLKNACTSRNKAVVLELKNLIEETTIENVKASVQRLGIHTVDL